MLDKATLSRVWGYLDITRTNFRERAERAAARSMDKERQQVLVTDYTKHVATLTELMNAITTEIDAIEQQERAQ